MHCSKRVTDFLRPHIEGVKVIVQWSVLDIDYIEVSYVLGLPGWKRDILGSGRPSTSLQLS